ncbi:DUF1919 domain-containing protein [Conservatibacter flavescens]|uniref:Exopolysaccharide biosynthesis protein n=1 Tax=Conservatibacter flavescens TaxID=28161 RepID=A0A2M8S3S6_9PAST|nr:DUF1919 domain-containing protein [Conservatibacter flavescens]PJG85738.1 exopolysaccharide biosynthesis protein [Conservatibacter flavescens]
MLHKIKRLINHCFRHRINSSNKQRLNNQDMSLLASNCNGALILHDLGQKFHSPFVNLYLTPKDFIRYLQNIPYYQNVKLNFEQESPYPIAKLEDISIHFMHYHSIQEAEEKWYTRSARINDDNLFIMMTDRDGCTYQDLQAFDQLPFPNKVVFTHQAYPEFSSAFYIKGFEAQGQVGDLFEYAGWFGQKYYDQFDYVNWFNQTAVARKIHQKA